MFSRKKMGFKKELKKYSIGSLSLELPAKCCTHVSFLGKGFMVWRSSTSSRIQIQRLRTSGGGPGRRGAAKDTARGRHQNTAGRQQEKRAGSENSRV